MESIGLISKNKKKVKKFFLGHDSTNRPNAFPTIRSCNGFLVYGFAITGCLLLSFCHFLIPKNENSLWKMVNPLGDILIWRYFLKDWGRDHSRRNGLVVNHMRDHSKTVR